MQAMVVEDEAIIRTFISFALRNMGCRVAAEVSYGEHAVETAAQQPFDLVFMDIRLKGEMDGVEAARRIAEHSSARIVFMSAYERARVGIDDGFPNMIGYLVKPVHSADIQRIVDSVKATISGTVE